MLSPVGRCSVGPSRPLRMFCGADHAQRDWTAEPLYSILEQPTRDPEQKRDPDMLAKHGGAGDAFGRALPAAIFQSERRKKPNILSPGRRRREILVTAEESGGTMSMIETLSPGSGGEFIHVQIAL